MKFSFHRSKIGIFKTVKFVINPRSSSLIEEASELYNDEASMKAVRLLVSNVFPFMKIPYAKDSSLLLTLIKGEALKIIANYNTKFPAKLYPFIPFLFTEWMSSIVRYIGSGYFPVRYKYTTGSSGIDIPGLASSAPKESFEELPFPKDGIVEYFQRQKRYSFLNSDTLHISIENEGYRAMLSILNQLSLGTLVTTRHYTVHLV